MKNVTINTGASWSGTFRSFQDGDIFRESNIDLQSGDLADRLGYLKAQLDGKGALASANAWTSTNSFAAVSTFAADLNGSGTHELLFTGWNMEIGPIACDGALTFPEARADGQSLRVHTESDADATVDWGAYDEVRVPQTTASRTYTLSGSTPREGARVRVYRARNTDAHTVTIKTPGGAATLAVMDASAASWVDLTYDGAWKVSGFSQDISSLLASV